MNEEHRKELVYKKHSNSNSESKNLLRVWAAEVINLKTVSAVEYGALVGNQLIKDNLNTTREHENGWNSS